MKSFDFCKSVRTTSFSSSSSNILYSALFLSYKCRCFSLFTSSASSFDFRKYSFLIWFTSLLNLASNWTILFSDSILYYRKRCSKFMNFSLYKSIFLSYIFSSSLALRFCPISISSKILSLYFSCLSFWTEISINLELAKINSFVYLFLIC